MFEELNERRQAVAYNIAKSFENDIEKAIGAGYDPEGGDGDEVEKAHQVGDVHPNGKWVWTEYKPGKFDWRGIKKNATEKKQKVEGSGSKADQLSEKTAKKMGRLREEDEKVTGSKRDADDKVKSSSKKNPSQLETISEVEDYAKSISGVTFKNVKSEWDDEAKAFELTYANGGKLRIDFLNNEEYVYELTDSNDKTIFSTNVTEEIDRTDWSIKLNPDVLVSQRIKVLKTKLMKLKGEETKARNKMMSVNTFAYQYNYKKASEAVSDMKTRIQKLQSLIGTF